MEVEARPNMRPNVPNMTQIRTYLGKPNMVKTGIREKILQNVPQTP